MLRDMPATDNLLFYGDNLDVLRRHIADESADLGRAVADGAYSATSTRGCAEIQTTPRRSEGVASAPHAGRGQLVEHVVPPIMHPVRG